MENLENNVVNEEVQTQEIEVKEQKEQKQPEIKTFTQAELDAILNKKFAQWSKKAELQAEAKAKEVEEAEKLKRMSESERQQAEIKKQLEELNRVKAEMAREKLSGQVVKELAARELPTEYAEYVLVEGDSDATLERLNIFAEKYKADVAKEVERQVTERLKGNAPTIATTQSKSTYTLDEIRNMTPEQINANWDVISKMNLL